MRKISAALIAFAFFAAPLGGQQSRAAPDWRPWQFLIGKWAGVGSGKPGEGSGSFSFELGLDQRILIRRNRSDYPASQGRPAYFHEDLMIVYAPEGGENFRAIYFDNEGHIIHYAIEFSQAATVTFLSDPVVSGSRFRLTYARTGEESLAIKFEVAPPGEPAQFSTYLQGAARRLGASKR